MFTPMNQDFGLTTQSNSMLMAMNIESGFTMKPNCGFMFVKSHFGWISGASGVETTLRPGASTALRKSTRIASCSAAPSTAEVLPLPDPAPLPSRRGRHPRPANQEEPTEDGRDRQL